MLVQLSFISVLTQNIKIILHEITQLHTGRGTMQNKVRPCLRACVNIFATHCGIPGEVGLASKKKKSFVGLEN